MTNIHSVIPPSFVCKIFLLSEGRGGLLKYVYNILVRSSAVISNEKIHCAKDNSLHQVLVCTFWVTFRLVPIYTSGVPVLPPCFRSCVAVHWCRFVCVQPLQMCCLVASLLQFVRYSLLLMNDIPGIHCSRFFWWSDPLGAARQSWSTHHNVVHICYEGSLFCCVNVFQIVARNIVGTSEEARMSRGLFWLIVQFQLILWWNGREIVDFRRI